PVGWQTYSFPINANSPTIPDGWVCTHGDGSPCTDPEWSQFLHRADLTSVGFYKSGFVYPNLGTWVLAIDNVELDFQAGPTPTPSPTVTPSPTATPRARPTPRTRPSPHARPTPSREVWVGYARKPGRPVPRSVGSWTKGRILP